MNEVRTNEKHLKVRNVDMGSVQRGPYWGSAVMVCDADEKGSHLWWLARAFSFDIDIEKTFVMGGGVIASGILGAYLLWMLDYEEFLNGI